MDHSYPVTFICCVLGQSKVSILLGWITHTVYSIYCNTTHRTCPSIVRQYTFLIRPSGTIRRGARAGATDNLQLLHFHSRDN
jgi:hypothetical protein